MTDARALLEPITAKVQEAYNPTLLLQAAIMRAGLALFESRYDEAFNYLQAVRPMVSAADERYFQAALLSQRLQAEFEQGRLHELIPLIEEVFQQSGFPGSPTRSPSVSPTPVTWTRRDSW